MKKHFVVLTAVLFVLSSLSAASQDKDADKSGAPPVKKTQVKDQKKDEAKDASKDKDKDKDKG